MSAKIRSKNKRRYTKKVEEDDLTRNFYEVDANNGSDKCTKAKKNKRDSESPYEVLRPCTNKINVKQGSQTVPIIKKAIRGCGYQFSTTPIDDLTASMLPSPPSIEHLFTNGLTNRKSIQSTPKSSRNVARNLVLEKGTLKQKRWVMTSLKRKNEGYEDDLFENRKIKLPFSLEDSDLPDLNFTTPECVQFSPVELSKTPTFKDCYSPIQLFRNRKNAEEYMHKRNKKRKNCSTVKEASSAQNKIISIESDSDVSSEARRLKCLELVDTLKKSHNSKELNDDSEEEDHFDNV